MKPTKYDIADPKERERLLWELSGYLADDKEAGRQAFLDDGTDQPGRRFALEALDELRRALPFSRRKPSGVYDPEKEIMFSAKCRNCGCTRYVRLSVGHTLDMGICLCVLEGLDHKLQSEGFERVLKIGDEEIIATGFKVFELMERPQKVEKK